MTFVQVSEQNHLLEELILKYQELKKCDADVLTRHQEEHEEITMFTSRRHRCCITNCSTPELPRMLWQSMLRRSLAHAKCQINQELKERRRPSPMRDVDGKTPTGADRAQ